MREKRPLSAGTILMLIFSAVVLGGSLFLYTKITDKKAIERLNPQAFISTFSAALSAENTPIETVQPAPTIRTTVVTIAPVQPAPSGESTAAPLPLEGPTPSPSMHVEEDADVQTPSTEAYQTVTLTAAGMACFQSDITDAALDKDAGKADYSGLLSALSPYLSGDLRLLTFEGLLTAAPEKRSDLLALSDAAQAVAHAGFNTVLLNHERALDYGKDTAASTVDAFKAAGVGTAGLGVGASANQTVELNGVRTAVLTYTALTSSRTKEQLKDMPEALNLYSADTAASAIKAARDGGAQLVVVCMHWGKTDANGVTNSQREAATKLAAAGADIILGANSSAVLPVELIETGERKTLVAYSLGTLVSESRSARAVISGLLLNVKVQVYASGRVRFEEIKYVPTYVWKQKLDGKVSFAVLPSAAEAPQQMNDDQKKNMANALKLIDKVMANGPAKR